MSSSDYEVIVIGAGAAGLTAASMLARAGVRALLVEARLRIGGRIWSHSEPGVPVPIELGAEFVHGRARSVFALLARAATAAVDTGGQHWTLREGKLERAGDLFAEIRRAMQASRALDARDLPFETYLKRHVDADLSHDARRFARTLAEGFDAADIARASARAIVEEWMGGSSVQAPQFRPFGGYGAALAHLAAELRGSSVALQLNTIVRSVRWKRRVVAIDATFLGQPFRALAKRAIVTLPLGVLQSKNGDAGAVRFVPALEEKRAAFKRLAPGPVVKVVLRFRTPFWEKLERGRYFDAAFFHAPQTPFPTFWTTLPVRTPLLVAWAAGPKAERLTGASAERIIGAALESLETLFGLRASAERRLEGAWVHDWPSDPHARGAYSYVTVGGENARAALAKPLLDTLFFAGEATDTEGEAGTVAGALQSGARAAREVLAILRRR